MIKELFGWIIYMSIIFAIAVWFHPAAALIGIPLYMALGYFGLGARTKPGRPWDNATYRTPWQR